MNLDPVLERLTIGRERYGHGVRVDDDTTTWGTKTNSWMEMANEEFLDAIIYVTADYIRINRDPETGMMGDMEIRYMTQRPGYLIAEDPDAWVKENPLMDDNDLILYIITNWTEMGVGRHKTLLCTLLNILNPTRPMVIDLSESGSDTSSTTSDFDSYF